MVVALPDDDGASVSSRNSMGIPRAAVDEAPAWHAEVPRDEAPLPAVDPVLPLARKPPLPPHPRSSSPIFKGPGGGTLGISRIPSDVYSKSISMESSTDFCVNSQ